MLLPSYLQRDVPSLFVKPLLRYTNAALTAYRFLCGAALPPCRFIILIVTRCFHRFSPAGGSSTRLIAITPYSTRFTKVFIDFGTQPRFSTHFFCSWFRSWYLNDATPGAARNAYIVCALLPDAWTNAGITPQAHAYALPLAYFSTPHHRWTPAKTPPLPSTSIPRYWNSGS